MIKEAIGVASTVEEAKAAALKELGVSADADVKIEVIEMPSKKVLGLFGGSPAKVKVSCEASAFCDAQAYIEKILSGLGIDEAKVNFEETDEEIRVSVECEGDYGAAIGRRGETLDAIQYLMRLVIYSGVDDSKKRVSLNIGNYREKREATLRSLAAKNAARVKKYGRNVVLDPMNPYERRIIHTTIQEIEGVSSHSVGSDNERKVVITLEEGFKPTNGARRGGRGGYNRDNRGPRRDGGSQTAAPSRPPRSDAASTSRYGKIEVSKTEE